MKKLYVLAGMLSVQLVLTQSQYDVSSLPKGHYNVGDKGEKRFQNSEDD